MGTAPLPGGGFSAHLLLEVIIFPCQASSAVSQTPAGTSSQAIICLLRWCPGASAACEGLPSQPGTPVRGTACGCLRGGGEQISVCRLQSGSQ